MNDGISRKLSDDIEQTRSSGFTDIVLFSRGSLAVDWHAEGADRVNFVFSCTKSILSILFGILADQRGDIFLTDSIARHLCDMGEKYPRIAIGNLLSMTSGIEWKDMLHGNGEYNLMVKGDRLEYVLSKPGMFFALGGHGQFLFILPGRELVVFIRNKVGKLRDMNKPLRFMLENILPEID